MMAGADATTIGRARVVGWPDGANRLTARLALAQMLAAADLRPTGLPPSAILIVQRLHAFGDRRLALRSGGRLDLAWERAGRDALAGLARSAVRPWDGPVPPHCPAVLFRDEAELLACLALDVSLGRAAERWWWQMIPGRRRWGSLAPGALPAIVLDQPALLPAVLRLLHERGQAAAVVQRLSAVEASAALHALCTAHGVALPVPTPASLPAWQQPSEPALQPASDAPWHPWLPAGAGEHARLTLEGETLLGVALALAHAPAAARHPAFGTAVGRWRQAQGAPPAPQRVWAQHPTAGAGDRTSGPAPAGLVGAAAPGSADPAGPARGAEPLSDPAGAGQPLADAAHSYDLARRALPAAGAPQTDPAQTAPQASTAQQSDAGLAAPPGSAAIEPAVAMDDALAAVSISTAVGGVLFLLNAMQQLDLPACFEADWRLASQVGPWGLLELLGRALLNSVRRPTLPQAGDLANLAADPLWAALAQLDGRQPGEAAGANVTGREYVLIPTAWQRWLGAGGMAGQRVDLASVSPLDGPLLAGVSRSLRLWLAVVAPLLRQMLAAALGGEAGEPATALLLRRGRLYVTSSHVDLTMPLDAVSLPVRIAGLDFDPGWLPALGRVVQFHYE